MNSKAAILEEIARSRMAIRRDFHAVAAELDVGARAKRVLGSRPALWLGGAAALGWVLAGPKRRTVRVVKERGGKVRPAREPKRSVVLGIFKLLVPVVKPALTAYAAKRLAELASRSAR